MNISPEQLERTWEKANSSGGIICKALGMCDAMCVASKTGSRPHIVSTTKGAIASDDGCIAWKSQRFALMF